MSSVPPLTVWSDTFRAIAFEITASVDVRARLVTTEFFESPFR